jgi:hypothetical protein
VGLSEHQAKQAVRIANVPEEKFEAAIEAPRPAGPQEKGPAPRGHERGLECNAPGRLARATNSRTAWLGCPQEIEKGLAVVDP